MAKIDDNMDLVMFQVKEEERDWIFGLPDHLITEGDPMPLEIFEAIKEWCENADYWCELVEGMVIAMGRKDILASYDPLIDALVWFGPLQETEKFAAFFTCPFDTPWAEGEILLDELDMVLSEIDILLVPVPDEQLKNELCTDTSWDEGCKSKGTETRMTVLWPLDMLDSGK